MADLYFFDTDCLSSFLLTNNEYILLYLFKDKIVLPSFVLHEANKYEPLKKKLNEFKDKIIVKEIVYGTEEYKLYTKLTSVNYNAKVIGKGEASAIALCKVYNGTLVSNNLKDVAYYVKTYNLKSLTTSKILKTAYDNSIINKEKANNIWNDMLNINIMLPDNSFNEYCLRNE